MPRNTARLTSLENMTDGHPPPLMDREIRRLRCAGLSQMRDCLSAGGNWKLRVYLVIRFCQEGEGCLLDWVQDQPCLDVTFFQDHWRFLKMLCTV